MMDMIPSGGFSKLTTSETGTTVLTITSGRPNLANMIRKCSIVFCEVADCTVSTSIHLE